MHFFFFLFIVNLHDLNHLFNNTLKWIDHKSHFSFLIRFLYSIVNYTPNNPYNNRDDKRTFLLAFELCLFLFALFNLMANIRIGSIELVLVINDAQHKALKTN